MPIPRVKICGITRPEDGALAGSFGADAIGLVFYPPSPRYVSDLSLAREIAQSVGPFVNVVALFVDAEPKQVEAVLSAVPIGLLQFHGNEDDLFCQQFSRPYIKALRVQSAGQIENDIQCFPSAQGILLDTYVKGIPGGTGERFNWGLVPKTQQALVIAGGLDAGNVDLALDKTGAYGVDVSGGVEQSPGIKSEQKLREFILQAKKPK